MAVSIALPREVAGIRLPDSALARRAVELVGRASPDALFTHVVRTFVFGSLVGRGQGLRYDDELFFLAALLHDLGLTAELRSATERFEVAGADAADGFLKEQGVPAERREIVWDAIALHTSIGIASRKRPEIALVHIGAGIDVIGARLDRLPPGLVEATVAALPRHDFKREVLAALRETVGQAPGTAMMTWLREFVPAEVPASQCPRFADLVISAGFRE